MRNNNFITFIIACAWASKTTAAPAGNLRGRELLRACENMNLQTCQDNEPRCKVLRLKGRKNQCLDADVWERCMYFDNEEEDCWDHFPECIYTPENNSNSNGSCENRLSTRSSLSLCYGTNDCPNSDEICVAFQFSPDPCLQDSSNSLGQCIERPSVCPSTTDWVCGCDGEDYRNPCLALRADTNIKYEGECNDTADRAYRRTIRNIDDFEYPEEYLWQFMLSSVSTDGNVCLTESECFAQFEIDDLSDAFRVVSDPDTCGCYRFKGKTWWSDHRLCTDTRKTITQLIGSRVRQECDLNRIYRKIRNVPRDTCISLAGCDEQCDHDGLSGVSVRNSDDSDLYGCYKKNGRCFWNSRGNNVDKSTEDLPNGFERVWCSDRNRDVRDIVTDTCLTMSDCEQQAEFENLPTTAIVRDFDSESICGCYEKGGKLYWARCGINGNFYGDLGGLKQRIHCHNVETSSYRLFNREGGHTHYHTHPHDIEDHYFDYYYDYEPV